MTDEAGRTTLPDTITALLAQPVIPGARRLAQLLADRYGSSLAGILFYGSCLRRASDEGLLDFYVVVRDYRQAHGRCWPAFWNRLLPPNVYYMELPGTGQTRLRCKYGVVSTADLERLTTPGVLQSYFWSRLAQPCRLLQAGDAAQRATISACVANAVIALLGETLPLRENGEPADPLTLWQQALTLTYGSELRPEATGKVRELVAADAAWYARITPLALAAIDSAENPRASRRRARLRWWLRRLQGRTLNVLRLVKAAWTFQGGIDYLFWKVARHRGVTFQVTETMRRHPWLVGLPALVRFYRDSRPDEPR